MGRGMMTGAPAMMALDGVLYVTGPMNHAWAVDARTGKQIWHYQRVLPAGLKVCCGPVNRGFAVYGNKLFMTTLDAHIIALSPKDGSVIWDTPLADFKLGYASTPAPLVVKDKVIVGGTGGDNAHRGYITALNTKNGRLAWRWYVIPAPGEQGNETWKGDSWRFGGGAPWLTGSYDPQLNTLYWGTGNAAADFYDGDRVPAGANKSGPLNLYTASVVALDPDTGKLKWHFQEVPDDVWDFDSAYEVLLMDREVKGRMRKILVHPNKSGLTFVLDRETGEYLGSFNVPEESNWFSGVTEDGKLVGRNEPVVGQKKSFCPSAGGAKSWNSTAYSPRTGLWYFPANELCTDITPRDTGPTEGKNYMNGDFPITLPKNRQTFSHVDAWDPVTGKRAWTSPYKYVLMSSMLATGGDLVFTGDPEGNFFALDARTGAKLWNFQTGAGHRGASISYSVNGRQYVAATTGFQQSVVGGAAKSWFPDADFRQGSTLVVFALPEGTR